MESTDTEVLISESIYGRHPVNMGGVLHSSLYHDKQIQHLHEHSVKKFGKLKSWSNILVHSTILLYKFEQHSTRRPLIVFKCNISTHILVKLQ